MAPVVDDLRNCYVDATMHEDLKREINEQKKEPAESEFHREDDLKEDEEDEYSLSIEVSDIEEMEKEAEKKGRKMEIIWGMVATLLLMHYFAAKGLYLVFTTSTWSTWIWMFVTTYYSSLCVTAGTHRLWAHKSYKANFGVRLFLVIGQTIAVQKDVINWVRDHRSHHKWLDSDADPHNINRGFFFSHMGWLMIKKHPKVAEMGSKVDLSDLYADPILRFQRQHYTLLAMIASLFLAVVPVYFWGESVSVAFHCAVVLRLVIEYHVSWTVNSVSHTFGYQPFETSISGRDSFWAAVFTNGEAWHNYHHTFPQDYRSSEYLWTANATAMMIDFFAYMGWVWDRKTMSKEAIERQKTLKGDHSRH